MTLQTDRKELTQALLDALSADRAKLVASLQKHVGSHAEAEEVVHRAFERALSRIDQLRDPARASAWLARIVKNTQIDELRKRTLPSPSIGALELLSVEEAGDKCSCVLTQLEHLKPEYASLLRLVVIDGQKLSEVAVTLGISPNNAMVRLHRARLALRERLAAHCGTTSASACNDCGCEERGCCPKPTT